jgi:amidase
VPAACCGIAGLKTTHGRVSLDGVWPLASTLDTVGPMATTIAGLTLGMQLLESGFAPAASPARVIGRLRTAGMPELEDAVDAALRAAEFDVVSLEWDGFAQGGEAFTNAYFNGITSLDHDLAAAHPDEVGADVRQVLSMVGAFSPVRDAVTDQVAAWSQTMFALFDRVELLALPTMPILPPRVDAVTEQTLIPIVLELTAHVAMFNAAGAPALAQPISAAGLNLPGSLQLVGPRGGEELLLATGAVVEAAAGYRHSG